MKLHDHGVYLVNGQLTDTAPAHVTEAEARKGTIAYGILKAHNTAPDMKDLRWAAPSTRTTISLPFPLRINTAAFMFRPTWQLSTAITAR